MMNATWETSVGLVAVHCGLNKNQVSRLRTLIRLMLKEVGETSNSIPNGWPQDLRDYCEYLRSLDKTHDLRVYWVAEWIVKSDKGFKMTTDERDKIAYRKNNKDYLGLTDEQCDVHRDIMAQAMSLWPESLMSYCKEQSTIYGFSGDAVACWVADWLKAGNAIDDPFANETPEEFEAGCRAAIEALGGPRNKDDTPGMDLTKAVKAGKFEGIVGGLTEMEEAMRKAKFKKPKK